MKISKSKKITFLMFTLSVLNGVIAYLLTQSIMVLGQVTLITYLSQTLLAVVLGRVKTKGMLQAGLGEIKTENINQLDAMNDHN